MRVFKVPSQKSGFFDQYVGGDCGEVVEIPSANNVSVLQLVDRGEIHFLGAVQTFEVLFEAGFLEVR